MERNTAEVLIVVVNAVGAGILIFVARVLYVGGYGVGHLWFMSAFVSVILMSCQFGTLSALAVLLSSVVLSLLLSVMPRRRRA